MATHRAISSPLRSSSRRAYPVRSPLAGPRTPSPSAVSRPSPVGYLLSRVVKYATTASATSAPAPFAQPTNAAGSPSAKIMDKFTGAGGIVKDSQVIGVVVNVRDGDGHRHPVAAVDRAMETASLHVRSTCLSNRLVEASKHTSPLFSTWWERPVNWRQAKGLTPQRVVMSLVAASFLASGMSNTWWLVSNLGGLVAEVVVGEEVGCLNHRLAVLPPSHALSSLKWCLALRPPVLSSVKMDRLEALEARIRIVAMVLQGWRWISKARPNSSRASQRPYS
ncbi:hypothetical protein J5N97_010491 [Dioscorea zingiberensis]|uniref:ATP synthase F1 beta subunit domain-containing protein n=1 Tax=Dioscorea zingiberensis TaxID=325984 RepID=A0A9D5CYU3_9LILI|nr:hypothetical protein J5N97_010491 [Dioscorea zingiberensis]